MSKVQTETKTEESFNQITTEKMVEIRDALKNAAEDLEAVNDWADDEGMFDDLPIDGDIVEHLKTALSFANASLNDWGADARGRFFQSSGPHARNLIPPSETGRWENHPAIEEE